MSPQSSQDVALLLPWQRKGSKLRFRNAKSSQVLVAHTVNPCNREVEAGGSLTEFVVYRVPGQSWATQTSLRSEKSHLLKVMFGDRP